MKIRTKFVSNSSSSSFIIKKNIVKEVENKIDKDHIFSDEYYDKTMSKTEVVESLQSEINTSGDLKYTCDMLVEDMVYDFNEKLKHDSCSASFINGALVDSYDLYDHKFRKKPYHFYAQEEKELLKLLKHKGNGIELWKNGKKQEENWIEYDKYNNLHQEFCEKVGKRIYEEIKDECISIDYADDTNIGSLMEHIVMHDLEKQNLVEMRISQH